MGNNSIQEWGKKINRNKRVNSICKPCWELKYCPYGPLVEDFPIKEDRSSKSCRIFWHDCPVFYCAEPLTETKELRRITRDIPRNIQFKVLKRDNQICQICGSNVLERDIEFDHIIPFSKGGPTEDHNIRLLCSKCNNKRKNNYEEDYLVQSFVDHVSTPVSTIIITYIIELIVFYFSFKSSKKREPSNEDIASSLNMKDDKNLTDLSMNVIQNFLSIFSGTYKKDFKNYKVLQYRWGFEDGKVHSIKEILNLFPINKSDYFNDEIKLINMLGWTIENNSSNLKKWLKY